METGRVSNRLFKIPVYPSFLDSAAPKSWLSLESSWLKTLLHSVNVRG